MPAPIPEPKAAAAPRTRKSFCADYADLRPLYTHGRPSATYHTNALLLPCNATATFLVPDEPPRPITATSSTSEDQSTAVAISPSGTYAVLALRSGRVDFIHLPSFRVTRTLRPFQDRAVVSQIAFDASGAYVALLSADGNVRVHDIENGDPTHIFRNAAQGVLLSAISFHPIPDTAALLLGAEDGSLLSCDLNKKNAKPRTALKKHVASVVSIAFADDGKTVVTASTDKLLCFANWNDMDNARLVASGEILVSVVRPGQETGKIVLSLGERGVIRRWHADKAREDVSGSLTLPFVKKQTDESKEAESGDDDDDAPTPVVPVSMTMSGPSELVVALSDHTLLYVPVTASGVLSPVRKVVCGNLEEIYDVKTLPVQAKAVQPGVEELREFAVGSNSPFVWIMRISAPAVGGTEARKISAEDEEEAEKVKPGYWSCRDGLRGHSGIILCVDSLTHAKGIGKGNLADAYLATSSRDKTARVWRRSRSSGKWTCMALAEGHTDSVGAVAISPRTAAGQFFIVTGAADRTIKLWGLDQAQKTAEHKERGRMEEKGMKEANEGVNEAAEMWSADDDSDQAVRLSAKWTSLAHDKDVNAVAISPDVQLVATGSQDRTVKLWDASKGSLRMICKGHRRGIWSVAFSSIDRIVASGSADATVRIWSVANGACLRTFQGHFSGVLRCTFISSGTQLASAGGDGLVKIWATRSGECVTTLDGHEDRAWGLDSIADGNMLVSGGADSLVRIWRDTTEEEARAEIAKRDEEALMAQEVQNAARAGRWSVAAKGALRLGMNQKLRSVVMDLITTAESPNEELIKMIRGIHDESVEKDGGNAWELTTRLFLCCRDWNASGGPKNAAIASRVLQALFSIWRPDQLCDSLGVDKRALVEALEAHCTRHLERVSAFSAKIVVLEHTLERMHALGKIEGGEGELGRKEKSRKSSRQELEMEEEKRKEMARRKRRKREEHPGEY